MAEYIMKSLFLETTAQSKDNAWKTGRIPRLNASTIYSVVISSRHEAMERLAESLYHNHFQTDGLLPPSIYMGKYFEGRNFTLLKLMCLFIKVLERRRSKTGCIPEVIQ